MTPTYQKDGYQFFREPKRPESILGDSLLFDPRKMPDIVRYAKASRIRSLRIHPLYHPVPDLAFLKHMEFLEGLSVLQAGLDLSYVNGLRNLRTLRLEEVDADLNFANLPNLEVLGVTYGKHLINLGRCPRLSWLWLEGFPRDDVRELGGLRRLRHLTLHRTGVRDLTGLETLTELRKLQIDTAFNLASLNGLSPTNAQLEALDVYGARKLNDYGALAQVKSLKTVWFSKTGDAPDLSFLEALPNLEKAVIGMKVLDGDMSCLKRVAGASFVDHPHYNLKMSDLKPV